MSKKLKSFLLNDHIFFGLLIVLVGVTSFGLGRLSVVLEPKTTSKIGINELIINDISDTEVVTGTQITQPIKAKDDVLEELVASKSGTKYHLLTCPSASQIKSENRILFSSRLEAEAAGYKPASNCPGLQ